MHASNATLITLAFTHSPLSRMLRQIDRHLVAFALVSTSIACGGGSDSQGAGGSKGLKSVSAAELGRLPSVAVKSGAVVCVATGAGSCPLTAAFANWLSDRSFALWEPGRPVLVVDAKAPQGRVLGRLGAGAGKYDYAVAVAPLDGKVAVLDGTQSKVVRHDSSTAAFVDEFVVPASNGGTTPGFIGGIPVLQSLRPKQDSGGMAFLKVQLPKTIGEQAGNTVLDLPVPWIVMSKGKEVGLTPLFAPLPRYGVDEDGTIVWTPSDSFWIQRKTFEGKVVWTLTSDRPGARISDADIDQRRRELERVSPVGALSVQELDSMKKLTGPRHPAIAGLLLEPKGRLLVMSLSATTRDSVEYFVLSHEGVPTRRFALGARVQPLLFRGDSLLVRQPTEGEPWEIRWLHLPAK